MTPIHPVPQGRDERHGIVSNCNARHCAKEFFLEDLLRKNSFFVYFETYISERRQWGIILTINNSFNI